MELVNELISDHWDIRELIRQLRPERLSATKRRSLLKQLLPLVEGHAEGESKVLTPFARKKRALRAFAVGDEEEHAIIASLVHKLKKRSSPELESARTHLLCELLEHHLDEEEEEYFPELREMLRKEESERMALRYRFVAESFHPTHLRRPKQSFLSWLAGRPNRETPLPTDAALL